MKGRWGVEKPDLTPKIFLIQYRLSLALEFLKDLDAFSANQHAKYGVTTTSGTQALICALMAAGVEPGEEVLVPALSFFASATCILFVHAIPVFVDVDPTNYNISPKAMEAAITDRTRAMGCQLSKIVPTHTVQSGRELAWVQ